MDAILGTAGHIDHGKTSLIKALTGINCDRLDEEKRRGITIELGFAWLDLPDGRRLGIIDVPGHERFVKNMVAGAAGIDCMLLVIAADEGVMPQTREHLDICTLLGIRNGIVALTKKDMVDADWLAMVTEDVAANLKGTFLEGAPILPVSSATGEGLEQIREAIFKLVSGLTPRPGPDILRLPVDRVFTLKGFGTVVTGTVISGCCNQAEELCIMPSGKSMRVRSLQSHGVQLDQARQGQRCAMNLQGVDVEEIERGDIVARPNSLFAARRWLMRLTCLPSSPHPLHQRMETHFHHGARECAARILFRDREELAPGKSALAEVHFYEPMAGVFGDHCVLRAHSPLRTIAGGILIDPLPTALRKRDPLFASKFLALEKLADMAVGSPVAGDLVKTVLSLRPLPGANEKQLAVLTGLPAATLAKTLASLKDQALCWDADSRAWIGKEQFDAVLEKCRKRAQELHKREPLKSYFAHNAFCAGWGETLPPKFNQKVLDEAVRRGILSQAANGLKLAAHEVRLDADQSETLAQLIDIYAKGAYAPPTFKEACESLGTDAKRLQLLVSHLCDTGQLVKIQEGFYYHEPALERILALVRAWFETHDNLDIAAMKTMFGISRKYAVPLLEHMDATHMTTRVGNERRLRGK